MRLGVVAIKLDKVMILIHIFVKAFYLASFDDALCTPKLIRGVIGHGEERIELLGVFHGVLRSV